MQQLLDSLIAEFDWRVPEEDIPVLENIYEKNIERLDLGFDPAALLVLDDEDAHQEEIERIKFRIREQIVARLMGRANSVALFGQVKPGEANSFTKIVMRMGMKPAKIYILTMAMFLLEPVLEPLAARSFARAILGRILAEEFGFKTSLTEQVEMGGLLLEIGRIPCLLHRLKEPGSLDDAFVDRHHPLLGLCLMRKFEMPRFMESILVHDRFRLLSRSLSASAVIDLADHVVQDSFRRHGKLLIESPLPGANLESTIGGNMVEQFRAMGYRRYVDVKTPPADPPV